MGARRRCIGVFGVALLAGAGVYVAAEGKRVYVTTPGASCVFVSDGFCYPMMGSGEAVTYKCFTLSEPPIILKVGKGGAAAQRISRWRGETYTAFE